MMELTDFWTLTAKVDEKVDEKLEVPPCESCGQSQFEIEDYAISNFEFNSGNPANSLSAELRLGDAVCVNPNCTPTYIEGDPGRYTSRSRPIAFDSTRKTWVIDNEMFWSQAKQYALRKKWKDLNQAGE